MAVYTGFLADLATAVHEREVRRRRERECEQHTLREAQTHIACVRSRLDRVDRAECREKHDDRSERPPLP
jgi:hypothetical protein